MQINGLVYDKIFRFNLLNKSKHTVGSIVNLIQSDSQKISNLVYLAVFISNLIALFSGIYLIYFYAGSIAYIILAVFILGVTSSTIFVRYRIKIVTTLLEIKDQRVQSLTNVINNIKFIKMKAWENFFHYKVGLKRNRELQYLFYLMIFNCANIFLSWFNISNIQMAFIISVTMISPDSITLVNISAIVSILKIFFDVQMTFPWTLGILADISVSIDRVEEFLQAHELPSDRIEECKG